MEFTVLYYRCNLYLPFEGGILMRKTVKIILIIAGILLFLGVAAWLLVPRILLAVGSHALLADVGEAATYCTAFDIRDEDVQTIDNGHIAIDIPAEMIKKEFDADSAIETLVYYSPDNNQAVLLMTPDDMSDMNLLEAENTEDTMAARLLTPSKAQLETGFAAMGNGLPDCAYNTFKCIALLEEEDNSFWNLNQASAYATAATVKKLLAQYETTQLYETEEIHALIYSTTKEDGRTGFILDIYRTDDLNTVSTVIINSKDMNEAYAVLNSARPAA